MAEVYVGLGFTTTASAVEIVDAVRGIVPQGATLVGLATAAVKAFAPALIDAAQILSVDVAAFTSEELAAVHVPSPSTRVEQAVGTASVAEAAAILATGHGQLTVGKTSTGAVTVAVASKVPPASAGFPARTAFPASTKIDDEMECE
ncbi:cobalamin biosynthesis protein CbiG [Rhodococcus sp. AD45-ID]|uniref:cobalamin biosynthesis protein n=1 Tax=unclassified Rhodococcus (in: high G+C Gram-positive bacteria) TaxID=192944 RepID=UPI0005E1D36A|nr:MULTISPECIES: cobalamin biosynthesis protein [unclassified Rhodococcus (in: high G+C Gram-positive bacteria)]KJF22176.1 cobalamin biosynthesis protein CbiG [Rhodococcus sp. AD45]NRI63979.1 cobalamin biosynthesis protein [Rhodococcus sp. MS16]PSR39847.1 cobalamin biosynthesis protein CbiG [Rhodococcus sp. AD45-ID]RZL24900.1 MAG: cobalamin biosynthesis protein [Rhodococcus sp. (in: high G+C Gram-positive bacteria)]